MKKKLLFSLFGLLAIFGYAFADGALTPTTTWKDFVDRYFGENAHFQIVAVDVNSAADKEAAKATNKALVDGISAAIDADALSYYDNVKQLVKDWQSLPEDVFSRKTKKEFAGSNDNWSYALSKLSGWQTKVDNAKAAEDARILAVKGRLDNYKAWYKLDVVALLEKFGLNDARTNYTATLTSLKMAIDEDLVEGQDKDWIADADADNISKAFKIAYNKGLVLSYEKDNAEALATTAGQLTCTNTDKLYNAITAYDGLAAKMYAGFGEDLKYLTTISDLKNKLVAQHELRQAYDEREAFRDAYKAIIGEGLKDPKDYVLGDSKGNITDEGLNQYNKLKDCVEKWRNIKEQQNIATDLPLYDNIKPVMTNLEAQYDSMDKAVKFHTDYGAAINKKKADLNEANAEETYTNLVKAQKDASLDNTYVAQIWNNPSAATAIETKLGEVMPIISGVAIKNLTETLKDYFVNEVYGSVSTTASKVRKGDIDALNEILTVHNDLLDAEKVQGYIAEMGGYTVDPDSHDFTTGWTTEKEYKAIADALKADFKTKYLNNIKKRIQYAGYDQLASDVADEFCAEYAEWAEEGVVATAAVKETLDRINAELNDVTLYEYYKNLNEEVKPEAATAEETWLNTRFKDYVGKDFSKTLADLQTAATDDDTALTAATAWYETYGKYLGMEVEDVNYDDNQVELNKAAKSSEINSELTCEHIVALYLKDNTDSEMKAEDVKPHIDALLKEANADKFDNIKYNVNITVDPLNYKNNINNYFTSYKKISAYLAAVYEGQNAFAYIYDKTGASVLAATVKLPVNVIAAKTKDNKTYRADNIVIEDGKNIYVEYDVDCQKITLNKKIESANGVAPLVVPFDVTVAEIKENLGEDAIVRKFNAAYQDELTNTLVVNFSRKADDQKLFAYQPYTVQAEAGEYSITVSAPNAKTPIVLKEQTAKQTPKASYITSETADAKVYIKAIYRTSEINEGDYAINSKTGNWQKVKVYKAADVKNKLDGGRLILNIENKTAIDYSIRFEDVEEGETTGIQNVAAENAAVEGVYTISGQKVNSMAKPGLYIVNGKKVLVK